MPPKKCADFCAKVYVPAAEKANPTSKNDRSTMTRMRMEECKRAYCNKGCKCTDAKATDAYIRLVEKAQLRGKEPDPAPCKRLVRCPNATKVIPCGAKGVGEGQGRTAQAGGRVGMQGPVRGARGPPPIS